MLLLVKCLKSLRKGEGVGKELNDISLPESFIIPTTSHNHTIPHGGHCML